MVELRAELDAIYTPLTEARDEVRRRWEDPELRARVDAYLAGNIPDVLRESPKAVLSRQVMSPNFESLHFLGMARESGLEPAFFEYVHDKFVAKNIDKYYLCRLSFFSGDEVSERNNLNRVTRMKIIDFDDAEGKRLSDLRTFWNQALVDFHHELAGIFPDMARSHRYDCSVDFDGKGGSADDFYESYLALFVCHGILFENYLLDSRQAEFTRRTILSAVRKVGETLGVRPLIVKLGPEGEEDELFWRYYPESIKHEILRLHTIS